ncbi:MAG: HPr family phosphocarrier protein [Phycisphaerae bacterium]
MPDARIQAARNVAVVNKEGLHTRPVMQFVDLASTFKAAVTVTNVTRGGDTVDGKSAMQMMLLEATMGCVLRIQAAGSDATEAVEALAALVGRGFDPAGKSDPGS